MNATETRMDTGRRRFHLKQIDRNCRTIVNKQWTLSFISSCKRNPLKIEHAISFISFMDKVFSKGHAETAPALQDGEECWFLPIFGSTTLKSRNVKNSYGLWFVCNIPKTFFKLAKWSISDKQSTWNPAKIQKRENSSDRWYRTNVSLVQNPRRP